MKSVFTHLNKIVKDKQWRTLAIVAFVLMLLGLAFSLLGFLYLQRLATERLYAETQQYMNAQLNQVQTNIDISLDSLVEIAALYSASNDVSAQQLSAYVLSDSKYHSGTVALGWVPKILGEQLAQFEQEVRMFDPDFEVYEVTGHGMPTAVFSKNVVFPIKTIMSIDNKKMMAGLNLASIGSRLKTMNKADRSKDTAITQRIMLYSDRERLYGFQAFHPVYKQTSQQREELAGFILGIYTIKAFIEDVFSVSNHYADIVVYDANTNNQQLLYSSMESIGSVDEVKQLDLTHWAYTLNVADQQWLMVVFPKTNTLIEETHWLPYVALLTGGVITTLLILYLFASLTKARQLNQLSSDLAGTTSQLALQTKLKQQADKANQAKMGLLKAASHDLRQPLHTIGLLTSLLHDSDSEAQRNDLVKRITSAVDEMDRLFLSLLDISLLESNQLTFTKKDIYLQDIFDQLASDFSIQQKQGILEFNVVATSVCVHSDPVLLNRILRNLLSNAFRYTRRGKILLGCRRLSQGVRICVYDTGIGLTSDAQERIFDLFHREREAKEMVDQGLGLGLSIVKELTLLLGIKMGVKSTQNLGSLFYLELPYGNPSKYQHPVALDQHMQVEKHIWLIEDDDATRQSLTEVLTAWRCDVMAFANGTEVKSVLEQSPAPPDIIIADYQMVNETGIELVKIIRTNLGIMIPTIIITGTTDRDVLALIANSQCKLMIKPVSPEVLNNALLQL